MSDTTTTAPSTPAGQTRLVAQSHHGGARTDGLAAPSYRARTARTARASMPATRIGGTLRTPPTTRAAASSPARTPLAYKSDPAQHLSSSLSVGRSGSRPSGTPERHLTPLHDGDGHIRGAALTTRCELLASTASDLLAAYEDARQRLEQDGYFEQLQALLLRKWSALDTLKNNELLAAVCALPPSNFLDTSALFRAAGLSEDDEAGRVLASTVQIINRATFVHFIYQLPMQSRPNETRAGDYQRWPLRSLGELVDARRAFWRHIAPKHEDVQLTDDEVMLYLDLTRQIIIEHLSSDGKKRRSQRYLEEIIASYFDRDVVAKWLLDVYKPNEPSSQARLAEAMSVYDALSADCIEEIEALGFQTEALQLRYPYATMADDLTRFTVYIDEYDGHTSAMPFFSTSLRMKLLSLDDLASDSLGLPTPLHGRHDPGNTTDRYHASQQAAQAILADKRKSISAAAARNEPRVQRDDESSPHSEEVNEAWTMPIEQQKRGEPSKPRKFPRGPVEQAIETEFDLGDDDAFLDREIGKQKQLRRSQQQKRRLNEPAVQGGGEQLQRSKGKSRAVAEADEGEDPNTPGDAPLRRSRRIRNSDQHNQTSQSHTEPATAEAGASQTAAAQSVSNEAGGDGDEEWEASAEELTRANEEATRDRKKKRKLRTVDRTAFVAFSAEEDPARQATIPSAQPRPRGRQHMEPGRDDSSDGDYDPRQRMSATARDTPELRKDRKAIEPNRYFTGHNARGRMPWTPEETACLLDSLASFEPNLRAGVRMQPYTQILQLHGPRGTISKTLAQRNNVQLKDKARNELLRLQRENVRLPAWADYLFRTI